MFVTQLHAIHPRKGPDVTNVFRKTSRVEIKLSGPGLLFGIMSVIRFRVT